MPVDFITYNNFPVVGTNTQYAIIFEGAGVGLTPGNPSTASIVTCPPFDRTLTFNATSTPAVATVQTFTGTGSIEVRQVAVADFDGDTVPNYNDLCDAVADPTNADGDADSIGNVCDPYPGVPAAPDADGDITLNANDSCPTTSGPVDLDDDLTAGDGVADSCDPAPTIPGDGNGYGFGYNGVVIGGSGVYSTHGTINNFTYLGRKLADHGRAHGDVVSPFEPHRDQRRPAGCERGP